MPRPSDKTAEKTPEAVPETADRPLTRHLVIVAGVDHVVMAADEADLQRQIASLRAAFPAA